MRPYLLVIHNYARLAIYRILHREVSFGSVPMMSRRAKITVEEAGKLCVGSHFINDGRLVIHVDRGASLSIGERVYMNEDAMISCKDAVSIGSFCKFGPNVKIFDNNHRFSPDRGVTNEHSTAPITIGEGTWIGANCVILKGTSIGKNCVIGAGCVVQGTIPERSVVTTTRELIITPME